MPFTKSDKNTADNSLEETRRKIGRTQVAIHLTKSMELPSSRTTKSDESTVGARPSIHPENTNQQGDPTKETLKLGVELSSNLKPEKTIKTWDTNEQTEPEKTIKSRDTNELSGPVEHIDTRDTNKLIPQQYQQPLCDRKFTDRIFTKYSIIITSVIIAAISLWYFTAHKDIIIHRRPTIYTFNECVSELSDNFPSQDPLLWKQIRSSYELSFEFKRTVLCQTFITHRANRNPLDCLMRKLSQCLGDKSPYVFSRDSDPISSASRLERDLNSTDIRVGYFREITDLTHPIPIVFHAICDPDHSPYKERAFLFTISSDSLNKKSGEYSHKNISKAINEVLDKHWTAKLFPSEQIAAVISRIADSAYYFQAESGTFKC